jgi:hypothetical protein
MNFAGVRAVVSAGEPLRRAMRINVNKSAPVADVRIARLGSYPEETRLQ